MYPSTKEQRKQMTNRKVPFDGKILMFGCGGVAKCVLPLLPKLIDIPFSKITVLDMVDNTEEVKHLLDAGMQYVVTKIDHSNLREVLSQHLKEGDFLVDLAWEIETIELLDWCRENNVKYVNASLEIWDPYHNSAQKHPTELTLYWRHMKLRKRIQEWGDNNGPTAVIDHGANPGLVSHFTKQALEDIANKVLSEKKGDEQTLAEIKKALDEENWAELSMKLGVKVIHISERDTQISSKPKQFNEFVNTWSPEGFFEEGVAPAEMGWGTHEKTLPEGAFEHRIGPKNQICLASKGMHTKVRSWVPAPNDSGDIVGMVIRHGEAFTISDHLTVHDKDGNAIYRPTVHYAYRPCDAAVASIDELRMRHYLVQPKMRVLGDEIISGQDILGCLLMGHAYKSWWIGSLLDIEESRELVPHQNATTLQVAISIVAAVQWAIENPKRGVCVPDDLPHRQILKECLPYLGPFISRPVDWTPLKAIKEEWALDYRTDKKLPPEEDTWQFSTFQIKDGC